MALNLHLYVPSGPGAWGHPAALEQGDYVPSHIGQHLGASHGTLGFELLLVWRRRAAAFGSLWADTLAVFMGASGSRCCGIGDSQG